MLKESTEDYNRNWAQIPDHPCQILIIGGSWSGKTNALLNDDAYKIIDNIYVYVKDPNEAKYQFIIKKLENKLS